MWHNIAKIYNIFETWMFCIYVMLLTLWEKKTIIVFIQSSSSSQSCPPPIAKRGRGRPRGSGRARGRGRPRGSSRRKLELTPSSSPQHEIGDVGRGSGRSRAGRGGRGARRGRGRGRASGGLSIEDRERVLNLQTRKKDELKVLLCCFIHNNTLLRN